MWSKVWYYSVEVRGKSPRKMCQSCGGLNDPPNSKTSIHSLHQKNSQNTKLLYQSVKLIHLHLVDANNHLIVQPLCLRHCQTNVYPILSSCKPKDSLSYFSLMIPQRFENKTTKELLVESGISLPAVQRYGSKSSKLLFLNNEIQSVRNIKTMKSKAVKVSYQYHSSKSTKI